MRCDDVTGFSNFGIRIRKGAPLCGPDPARSQMTEQTRTRPRLRPHPGHFECCVILGKLPNLSQPHIPHL